MGKKKQREDRFLKNIRDDCERAAHIKKNHPFDCPTVSFLETRFDWWSMSERIIVTSVSLTPVANPHVTRQFVVVSGWMMINSSSSIGRKVVMFEDTMEVNLCPRSQRTNSDIISVTPEWFSLNAWRCGDWRWQTNAEPFLHYVACFLDVRLSQDVTRQVIPLFFFQGFSNQNQVPLANTWHVSQKQRFLTILWCHILLCECCMVGRRRQRQLLVWLAWKACINLSN